MQVALASFYVQPVVLWEVAEYIRAQMKGHQMNLQTIQIEIGQETARLLTEKAAAHKLSLDEYLRAMAEEDYFPKLKTLDEILAPFRAEVEAKGYSEDELDEFFTEARKEVFQIKQQAKQQK